MGQAGRKKGSKNLLNKELSGDFSEFIKSNFKREIKYFPRYDPETKVNVLLKALPFVLPKGDITIRESEIQTEVFDALLPHYIKLRFYLAHLPQEKKITYLIRFLKQMRPLTYQQDQILDIVKQLQDKTEGGEKFV